MKVFLTGGSGYVGSVVAEKLLEHNHEVFGLARNDAAENKLIEKGDEPLRGDLTDLESLEARRAPRSPLRSTPAELFPHPTKPPSPAAPEKSSDTRESRRKQTAEEFSTSIPPPQSAAIHYIPPHSSR
jgi:hypothetical protein